MNEAACGGGRFRVRLYQRLWLPGEGVTLDVAHVGNCDLGPLRLQTHTAFIFPAHHGADG